MRPTEVLKSAEKRRVAASAEIPLPFQLIRFYFKHLSGLQKTLSAHFALRIFSTPGKPHFKAHELTLMQQAQQEWIQAGDLKIRTYTWGNPDAPAVLLAHGWACKATTWSSWIAQLLEKGFRVVAFDAPAHGQSPGTQTHLLEFAACARAVLKKIRKIEVLIAHSLGGAASVLAIESVQQEISLKKLVIMSAPSYIPEVFKRFGVQLSMPESVRRKMESIIEQRTGERLETLDIARIAGRIKAEKVLVVHDREDETIPFGDGEALVAGFPAAEMLITEGFGHNRILRDRMVIERVIRFAERAVKQYEEVKF